MPSPCDKWDRDHHLPNNESVAVELQSRELDFPCILKRKREQIIYFQPSPKDEERAL